MSDHSLITLNVNKIQPTNGNDWSKQRYLLLEEYAAKEFEDCESAYKQACLEKKKQAIATPPGGMRNKSTSQTSQE